MTKRNNPPMPVKQMQVDMTTDTFRGNGSVAHNTEVHALREQVKELRAQLREKSDIISFLHEIGYLFTKSYSLDRILLSILDALTEQLKIAEAGSIWLVTPDQQAVVCKVANGRKGCEIVGKTMSVDQGIIGQAIISRHGVIENNVKKSEFFCDDFDKSTGFNTLAILCCPLRLKDERIIGVIELINKPDGTPFCEDDLELVRTLSTSVAISIENGRLYIENQQREILRKELALAHKIQMKLLPEQLPDLSAVDIAAHCTPSKVIGGDYYDFIKVDADHVAIIIGDVSGKSISAALFMTMSKSLIWNNAKIHKKPRQVLCIANQIMQSMQKSYQFITVFYILLNIRTLKMQYCSAGHAPVMLYRAEQDSYIELNTSGHALGISKDARLEEKSMQLQSGDRLLLYTDGLIDARDKTNAMFGFDRLFSLFKKHYTGSSAAFLNRLFTTINEFQDNTDQFDDMTAIVMRIKDPTNKPKSHDGETLCKQ